jgi:23S rRNA (guanosine2251-2'-O)-methyltransferase
LTPAAVKAAAGATEHLLLAPVADLAGTIADLRAHGLRAIGADQDGALSYSQADFRGPLALVVGSEGFGISGQLRRRLDQVVRIPMRGKVASLNAAVAGSVLLFAAAEQRGDAQPPTAAESDDAGRETTTAVAVGAAAETADATGAEPIAGDLLPDDTAGG